MGAGGGCHPAWDSARKQEVRGGAHSPGTPGCRSSRLLPPGRPLHLCLPSGAVGGDPGGGVHGGGGGGQPGEAPGLGEVQVKSGGELGLGLGPVAPRVVWAWPCGPPGSR